MRRTFTITAGLLAAGLALAGCSAPMAGSQSDSYVPQAAPMHQEMSRDSISADGGAADLDRQVITTGYVTVVVEQPLDAAAEATRITESAGGRVDGRTEYAPVDGRRGSATLTLRLPADSLTEVLDQLKALGEVDEVSLYTNDVTMESRDLDARITALEAAIERLLALLATADTTEALIQLETAITDRQAELESLKSQQRYLADQVSMSTVTLNLISTQDAPVDDPVTFLDGLAAGWNAFVAFFAGLLVALGVLLPWLVLAGIVAAVIIVIVRRNRKPAPAPTPPVE